MRFTPVFCDHCCSLALAELDSEYLCTECLFSRLKSSEDPDLVNQIRPMTVAAGASRYFQDVDSTRRRKTSSQEIPVGPKILEAG